MLLTNKDDKIITSSKNYILNHNKIIFRTNAGILIVNHKTEIKQNMVGLWETLGSTTLNKQHK